jgi:hypothetical protein
VEEVAQFLKHAEECRALAAHAYSNREKTLLLDIAATWEILADDRRTKLMGKRPQRQNTGWFWNSDIWPLQK